MKRHRYLTAAVSYIRSLQPKPLLETLGAKREQDKGQEQTKKTAEEYGTRRLPGPRINVD